MLRSSVQTCKRQLCAGQLRKFSQSSFLLNEVKVVVPVSPPKKKFSFPKFLFKTSFYAIALYGGVLYASTFNDDLNDYVLDNVPYAEEIFDYVNDYDNIEKFTSKIPDLKTEEKAIEKRFQEVTKKAEQTTKKVEQKVEQKVEAVVEEAKKAVVEVVAKTPKKLPTIQLPENVNVDASVKSTINSLNELIGSIQDSTASDFLFTTLQANVQSLAKEMSKYTADFQTELAKEIEVQQAKLQQQVSSKEIEITEAMLDQFNREKENLINLYNGKLYKEVEATKDAISQAAVNAITMMRVEQIKYFTSVVEDKITQERNGKLAQLSELIARVDKIEQFASDLDLNLSNAQLKSDLQLTLSKLRSILALQEPKSLKAEISTLKNVSQDNSLLKVVIKSFPEESVENGVLTNAQLITRWQLLVPELRSASLLPPNAGLLGHFSSLVFSKLLANKNGVSSGNDIESVIARVNDDLAKGLVDDAVQEVASLKGWCRTLANDWIVEGRKKVEVNFLIELVDAEAKTL